MNSLINAFIRRPVLMNSLRLGQFIKMTPTALIHSSKIVKSVKNPTDDDVKLNQVISENETEYYEDIKDNYNKYREGRSNETLDQKRSRLVYQSRKRGITETGILLKSFADRNLPTMTEKEMDDYDKIINTLYNEWYIYYWITGAVPIPQELETNSVIHKMKEFCLNVENKKYFQN